MAHNHDLIVIGGGPAGYAAAIRAGQLKKRVLCIEKEDLGGTCLNWGCIPTKALLENGALVRRLRRNSGELGLSFDHLQVDFGKIIGRSRAIADRLAKGIGHLFRKYEVKFEPGVGQLLGPHRVKLNGPQGSREVTAEHIILATGARARSLPGVEIDEKTIITSRQALVLPEPPKRLAIIGAGAIGCEFADFYNAMGSEVTLIELMDHILPAEDEDVSIVLERVFTRYGIKVLTRTKTERVEKTDSGARLQVTGPRGPATVEADIVLMAVGVMGNVEGLAAPSVGLAIEKNHVKVEQGTYRTNIEGVWAVGDVIGPPWLAHVAHHEAVNCVERMFGVSDRQIDYRYIPACTYTHPQVASMGLTEKTAREDGRPIRVGKFPFTASGRALALGETDGFVKMISDAKYGEVLGVHMIGENVTELLSELVVARDLEATADEIIHAMHPHPTLSEAVMEAAGVLTGRSIHL
jgi:dihydrolipoamide dehydrogenase